MNVFKEIIRMYEDHKTRAFIVALCNSVDRTQLITMTTEFGGGHERCPITHKKLYSSIEVAANQQQWIATHRRLPSGVILTLKGGVKMVELTAQNVGVKSPTMKCWVSPEGIDMLAKFRTEVLIPNMELEEGKTVTIVPKIKISSMTRKPVGTLADVLANPKPQQRRKATKQGTALSMK
jgi:hypothetical protein